MVGITERGDASNCYIKNIQENLFGIKEVFEWEQKLNKVDFAILITKCVTDDFINAAIRHKNKVIVHATVTGHGGTQIEPNVYTKEKSLEQVKKLLGEGFPVKQVVLRVDPIIPDDNGIEVARGVLELFKETGIRRVRYSFLDMYPHVIKRFKNAGLNLPYETFTAPAVMISKAIKAIHEYSGIYEFESCAEGDIDKLGCVSEKDYKIVGIPFIKTTDSYQRKGCSCINKKELLSENKRCANKCLYCYWFD